jgi:uncharacterized oligopeptide transporter (OPT) family protein
MVTGGIFSALLMAVREDARLLGQVWYRIPEMLPIGPTGPTMAVGMSWSLLSVGSGMLISMRVNVSMVIGMAVAWVILPPWLLSQGLVPNMVRREMLFWIMWPATGVLVAGGLMALVLRWRVLVKTFQSLAGARFNSQDFPIRWVIWGSIASAIGLVAVQKIFLGMPIGLTIAAIVLSVPLMLVGIRVLGETNWGPISTLSNMMQGIFGVLAPGQLLPNVVSTGVTGSVASQSEGLMQDYKTGYMIGSTPRYLTYAQLLAVPVGAAAVSWVYPLLRATYGVGGDHGLQSPISQRIAGFGRILSQGVEALPPGAVQGLLIGTAIGIVLTLLEETKWKKWVLSPAGLGIGMLVPGTAVFAMFVGGVLGQVWKLMTPRSYEQTVTPLATGFIAGEAIIAVVIPILVAIGLVHLH